MPQLADLARNGLDGKAEEVCHVRSSDGQIESNVVAAGRAKVPAGDRQKQAGNPLCGTLATKRHHPISGFVQIAEGLVEQAPLQVRTGGDQGLENAFREAAELDIGCRFRGQRTFGSEQPPDHVRSKLEPHELLSAVAQDARQLDCTIGDVGVAADLVAFECQGVAGLVSCVSRVAG